MPDDRKKISALPSALTLDNTDVLPIVQGMNSTPETKKAAITLLATHLLELMSYNNLSTANKTIVGAINSLLSNFADAYDDTSTYDVGDCVIYNGVIYQCNTAITVAEAWDATHWTAVKAVDVGAGGGGLSPDIIADEYDSTQTYDVGDYVIYEEELYICNTKITVAEAWNAAHWTQIQVSSELKLKADKKAVEEALVNMLPIANASGAVANFNTELNLALISLKAAIVATQASGTPTPSTPIPISGWSAIKIVHTGKNLTNATTTNTIFWGTDVIELIQFLNTLPVGRYTISNKYKINETPSSGKVIHGRFVIRALVNGTTVDVTTYSVVTDNNPSVGKVYQESVSFEITDAVKGKINHVYGYCDQDNPHSGSERGSYDCYDIQVETGSVATDYEPYDGNEYIINLGGTYYGGHFTQDKDGHRQFEVTYEIDDIGVLGWNRYSFSGVYCFYVKMPLMKTVYANCLSSAFEFTNQVVNPNLMQNNQFISDNGVHNGNIYLRCDEYSDVPSFQTAMSGQKIVYELATPYTIDLPDGTPIDAFQGVNNVYADSGDILECKYKDTIQHYIDTQIAATQALIL